MTVRTKDRPVPLKCEEPGVPLTRALDSYRCAVGDVLWPVPPKDGGPTQCATCHIAGTRIEGYLQETYECPTCEEVWHIADGERCPGFPEGLPLEKPLEDAWLERLDSLYPPVQPSELAYALFLSSQLVAAECLDPDQWAESRRHPAIADRDGFLLDITGPSWRAMTSALRRRFRHGPTRLSVQERALLVEGLLRRGDLSDWVTVEHGVRRIHPAVLEVFARTPAHELEERPFAEWIRQVALQGRAGEASDGAREE